jgi:phosphohistidine phosphatase
MKTLFLLRHAKSQRKNETLPDFERLLTGRGKRTAETVGRYLRSDGRVPQLILSSPAVRTRETVELVMKAAKWTTEVRYDQRIYDADGIHLAEVVAQIENDRKVALIVGHNPGIEELFLLLTGNGDQIPAGSMAKLRIKTTKWANAVDKRATLEWLLTPGEMESALER